MRIFGCDHLSPLISITDQEEANKLLIESCDSHSKVKSKEMKSSSVLAALCYLASHIDYRSQLDKAYPNQEEKEAFCPKISEKVSGNLYRRLIAAHLLQCHNLHSGSQIPKSSAFLLYFSNIYLQLAKENQFDPLEKINEGDFLVILVAVV